MAGEGTIILCDLESCDTMDYQAPAAGTKGDTFIYGDLVVFLLDDVAANGLVGICHDAEKAEFPKTAGLAINQGQRVYWNDANKVVTLTAADRAIGWCYRNALAGDSEVRIRFHQELESTTY
jgi:predicted RecA/RadA family phage recombinase